MKIAVIGCGGVGGVIAASLLRAGHDVTPVVGSAALVDAMTANGLTVIDRDGLRWSTPLGAPARAVLTAEDGPFDLVLLAVQTTRLEEALSANRAAFAAGATVVTCQNGLPEARAAALVGDAHVLGCVVGWGASMVEPAVYQRTSRGVFELGRPSAAAPDVAALAQLLSVVAEARIVDDLAAVRWSKLAINCATSTIGAVGGDALGPLLAHRFARRIALEIFAEVALVARAQDIKMRPVGGTLDIERIAISDGERGLAFGSPALAYKHSLLFAVGLKYRRMRSSMLYALERGRPPEIDALNGEVVRSGARLGVATPVNAALVGRVHAIAAGTERPSLALLRGVYDEVINARAAAPRAPSAAA